MPAFPEDVEQALRERVQVMPSWGPHRVVVRRGALAGMELARCSRVFDAAGRFAPVMDESERVTVAADQVVLAIGQGPDLGYARGVPVTGRGLPGGRSRNRGHRAAGGVRRGRPHRGPGHGGGGHRRREACRPVPRPAPG